MLCRYVLLSVRKLQDIQSYSDDEFVRKCLVTAADILCPNNSNNMHTIRISCRTVTRHIGKPGVDLEQGLRAKRQSFKIQSTFLSDS
jgi:hypothetical protein